LGPIRVVHFERRSFPGQFSIERVFAQIRPRLPDRFDVRVVTTSHFSKGLRARLSTVLEARRLDTDVLHVTGDITYAGLLTRRDTTVLTIHDLEFLNRAGWLKAQTFTWLWLRVPILRAAAVTVPSEATRRDLLSLPGIPARKLVVIPLTVGPEFVPIEPEPEPEPEPDPGHGSTLPVVLMVGTRVNKNVQRAAEALASISCRVVVLGHLDPAQQAAFARSGVEVTELGEVDADTVVAAYIGCDLLLYPSTKEGFGLPIVEAQATGRPVVTSMLPPMSDVAGGAACLVDPLDVGSIREGVARVLGDPGYRADLVERGFENARRFEVGQVALQYAEVYDRVAARAGHGRRRGLRRSGPPAGRRFRTSGPDPAPSAPR
jgi:glycosyltransferase involved in cell wall biosynthesis